MDTPDAIVKRLPNGCAWASILAAGAGCAAFGLLVDLAQASKPVSNQLNFYKPSGDLSGKTIVAIVLWLIVWVILHARWKNRNIESSGKIMALTLILILLALIAVFPPFVDLLAAG
jgi:hypothetical protein